jgi:hypothetical protein
MEEKIPYNAPEYSRYNDYLDEEGPINILGTDFTRSEILYNMDNSLYKQAYQEFEVREYEENLSIIYDLFPSNISISFRKLYMGAAHADASRRVKLIIDCSEALISFFYGLVISEAFYKKWDLHNIELVQNIDGEHVNYRKVKARELFDDKIAIRIRVMQAIAKWVADNNEDSICSEIPFEVFELLYALNQVRNKVAHSSALSNEQYERILHDAEPLLKRVISQLIALSSCELLRFHKYENGVMVFESFNGHSSVQEWRSYTISTDNIGDILSIGTDKLLVKWNEDIFTVAPYIHFTTLNHGHESAICTFKKYKSEKFTYENSKNKEEICFEEKNEHFIEMMSSIKELIIRQE